GIAMAATIATLPANAQPVLKVVYPPPNHETTADRIFLIGTAPPDAPVTLNGETLRDRSPSGHFSPTVPLQMGTNTFTLNYRDQTLALTVIRKSTTPQAPVGLAFAEGSLTPAVDIARQFNDPICFSAIAPPRAQVAVTLGDQTIPLALQSQAVDLPPNSAVLTQSNMPAATVPIGLYQGCTVADAFGDLGRPTFTAKQGTKVISQAGPGQVTILPPQVTLVTEVTSEQGVARTGPSTDYSRLTPLPKGTRAQVTGREGEWFRLDYGGWIKKSETRPIPQASLPKSLIRSVKVQTLSDRTKVIFPLQVPVPIAVQQGDRSVTLTLYNTTAQTDTIAQTPGPVLSRLDWQQIAPGQVQYRLQLKPPQQWGYSLHYEGTSLVLSLRHPPVLSSTAKPLQGTTILLDPGHGSANDLGSVGPTGYPEKDVALTVSKLLQQELVNRGAQVVMTRTGDEDLLPQDRVKTIEAIVPTLALSLHYNALPDNGDAWNTKGVSTYWYHPQAQGLATFLHDYLVQKLGRSSYGVYWNNLALTRPAIAPAVLIELGFMINPNEFEWIIDAQAQQQLAKILAEGLTIWMQKNVDP
ncbi:MAG: N-acetylmuramoyl-L-alanine amidase, partial [Thermosynechococcaceae cyanobacterium]